MTVPELNVELREATGKGVARKLRAQGMIPGVLYGSQGESAALTVDPQALKKLIVAAPSPSFLVNLKINKKVQRAMLKDFQIHPIKRDLVHADFLRVEADQAVTLEVAIDLIGEPVGLTDGGNLEVRNPFISLSGLPDKLPQSIEMDISQLAIGDLLRVSDLVLEEGIEPVSPPDTILCAVVAPVMISEEEEAEEGEEIEGEAAEGEGEAEAKAEPEGE